jgi:hypothetical protein
MANRSCQKVLLQRKLCTSQLLGKRDAAFGNMWRAICVDAGLLSSREAVAFCLWAMPCCRWARYPDSYEIGRK